MATQFDYFLKIDLEKRRDLHAIFSGSLDPNQIVNSLELATDRITPGKTLFFFDEIQACPEAIMALRYFYEEIPEFHVVSTSFLLEFSFGEISIPVGCVQYFYMYPVTFYEYLLANNKEPMAEYIY